MKVLQIKFMTIQKFIIITNFKIKYFLIRSLYRCGWKNRRVKCRFKEIQKYLFNLDKNSKEFIYS